MSAFTKSSKTSRWGSLLQGAVANLESRLDTILAEEGASKRAAETARSITPEPSRSPRPSRDSDNQERASTPSFKDETHNSSDIRSSGDFRSTISPESAEFKQWQSEELVPAEAIPQIHVETVPGDSVSIEHDTTEQAGSGLREDGPGDGQHTGTTTPAIYNEDDMQLETNHKEATNGFTREPLLSVAEYQAQLTQMKEDYATAELQRQEDMHAYVERIDALQAKLQYLANEAVESARSVSSEMPSDSVEWKLAVKNEQIALLMEEGRKLSKTEVDQSTIIKKLRAKSVEDGRSLVELKRRLGNSEKSATDHAERASRLEGNTKEAVAKVARLTRVERELDELRKSRDAKDSVIETLRRQVDNSNARADVDQKRAVAQAVEVERKVIQTLRDDITSSKVEKQLSEDRARHQVKAANDELQRERERSAALEQGLRNEISALEGRLEVFRVRTEEVSSGITSDSQAKLMRQIETLQAQYSQASENWQGIESSLQARLNTLESEKDEAARQESEARRKARETSSSARHLQDQLDDVSRKCNIMEHELNERQAYAGKLQSRVAEFEETVQAMKEDFDRERQGWEANLSIRIDEEKVRWRQEMNQEPQSAVSRVESPTFPFNRKPYGLELPSYPARRTLSRNASVEFPMPPLERQFSLSTTGRRSSAKIAARSPDPQTPNGLESGRSTPYTTPNIPYNIPETPSIHNMEQDDPFETGSSPQHTVNDVISVSTAAAGPSVQLVERMSATVRRLESEKAASKDEMARLSAQRDGARKEVVSLMREVDSKRAVDAKVAKLDREMAQLGQRYQTTLEMLGEKSERVEELEADVADLKKIYRELIESTMK